MSTNARKVFVNRQINIDSPMPENIGDVQMGWYDMDSDTTHNENFPFYCDDPQFETKHDGHEWRFFDEHHHWVVSALRHPKGDPAIKNMDDMPLSLALRILRSQGLEVAKTPDGECIAGIRKIKKGIK